MIFNIKKIDYNLWAFVPFHLISPTCPGKINEYLVGGPEAPVIIDPDERITLYDVLRYKYGGHNE